MKTGYIKCFMTLACLLALPAFAEGRGASADSDSTSKWNSRHIKRFDLKPETRVFIPKGNVFFGGAVGYNSLKGENYNFLILKNIDGLAGYYLKLSPYVGGFVADNFAIGGRFNYTRYMGALGNLDLSLGEDLNISLRDLYAISHKYDANLLCRYYIPFGNSRVVGMFIEPRLEYAFSQSKNTTGKGEALDGSYQTGHSIGLYVNPGLCIFMNDFVAAEFGIGIFGIDYSWKDTLTNQVEDGYVKTGGVDLKLNLLSINFGITFYL